MGDFPVCSRRSLEDPLLLDVLTGLVQDHPKNSLKHRNSFPVPQSVSFKKKKNHQALWGVLGVMPKNQGRLVVAVPVPWHSHVSVPAATSPIHKQSVSQGQPSSDSDRFSKMSGGSLNLAHDDSDFVLAFFSHPVSKVATDFWKVTWKRKNQKDLLGWRAAFRAIGQSSYSNLEEE